MTARELKNILVDIPFEYLDFQILVEYGDMVKLRTLSIKPVAKQIVIEGVNYDYL